MGSAIKPALEAKEMRTRLEVTQPFLTPRDEAAFWRIADALPPEDSDLWVQLQNRRDPISGLNTKEDAAVGFALLMRAVRIELEEESEGV